MNLRRMTITATVAALAIGVPARGAGAQDALLPTTGWGIGTAVNAWHFSSAVPQAAGAVADVAEVAVPFRVRSVFGNWSFDLSGAAAMGAAHLTSGAASDSGGGGDRLVTIYGPTDLRLRLTGPLMIEGFTVTAGVNIPTGKVGLNGDETTALQAVGAPALRMPIGAFGTGPGATLGLIRTLQGDDWAVALGGSVEQRAEYSPIALALSNGKADTKVTPGTAIHLTAGLDRALGDGRWSVLAVGDVFSKDKVRLAGGDPADTSSDYTLGPQLSVLSQMEFAWTGWRESSLNLAARYRSEYADATGARVSGSSGSYLEATLGGVRGGPEGAGLILVADGRWQSGLKFTDALVGAAVTEAGLTLGLERASSSTLTRYTIHGQFGSFDTGTTKTSGFGATIGMSISARREAR
ncbi:MAG TPA: transporter [Gemmatimonadaceae bacterium]|nr:transporter [Gemmatimonadaceae bacterium]